MPASHPIEQKIAEYPDWRGKRLETIRRLVREADPQIVEDCKWRGAPTWSHDGLVCVANIFKATVKVVFARGAKLADPEGIFNSELAGNAWRGITLAENDLLDERAFKAMIRSAVSLNGTLKVAKSRPRTAAAPGRTRRK